MIDNTKSKYTKIFDVTNPCWLNNNNLNIAFLKAKQAYYNDVLRAKGYLFLKDVYEGLGFTATEESLKVGWFFDLRDDALNNYVDFDLWNNEFNGQYIVLDFNVDGDITKYLYKDQG